MGADPVSATIALLMKGLEAGAVSAIGNEAIVKPLARTEQEKQIQGYDDMMEVYQKQYTQPIITDKIEGMDSLMSDPMLASLLGGGDYKSLEEFLLGKGKSGNNLL